MPEPRIVLPRDEGPQPDPVEWWYWNGHLQDKTGHEFAYMLALFKGGIFGIKDIFFAHWQVSDLGRRTFDSYYKTFWYGLDRGSFDGNKLNVQGGETLSIKKTAPETYNIATPEFDLKMKSLKPPLLAGGTGFIDLKSATTMCYSLTRLETAGKLQVDGRRVPVTGLSWMDHQWSPLTFNTEHAWIWFGIQLDDGTDLMCFEHGVKIKTRLATMSLPDGKLKVFPDLQFKRLGKPWVSPVSDAAYPEAWKISIPSGNLALECRADIAEQEMIHGPFRYWEGPVRVTGEINGKKVSGKGFLELNGVPGKTFARVLREKLRRML